MSVIILILLIQSYISFKNKWLKIYILLYIYFNTNLIFNKPIFNTIYFELIIFSSLFICIFINDYFFTYNMNMKYSFIVCAYNAEKYLKECLDSLVNQKTKAQYEIILVNDGSTDETENIAKKYKKVKIVNQKNKGLSSARNTGLKHVTSSWIIYVDADDYVSTDLLSFLEECEIDKLKNNFIKIYEKKDHITTRKDHKRQSNKMDDSIVSRAIHKSLFENYSFPSQYRYAIEDWDFYVHNLHKLRTLDISNSHFAFYYYRFNEESLSKSNKVYRSRLEHAISIFKDPELRKLNLEQNIIGHYYQHLYMTARLWFPDLLNEVKNIKYKTKVKFSIKLQYWIVKLGIFNWAIRKSVEKVDQ